MSEDAARPVVDDDDADLDWCHDAVRGVSRTFALTVDVLDEPMSRHICLGYLLCRVADPLAHASHLGPGAHPELLNAYDDAPAPASAPSDDDLLAQIEPFVPPPSA